ncbi:MAG: 1-deoxy-D-xylulose-5-phosphate synthase [Clostridia bacterium]|nr:1-deoxy-D-xylulose-5-phosphate synthase [Clostridia bacterium]
MSKKKKKVEYRTPLLDQYVFPDDLKDLPEEALPVLAQEIRNFLITHVSKTGGHLASNLGVVELTIAIHRVFDLPTDHLIFDVGHQSYVHKILTGRKDRFDSLRRSGGLSGFTRRDESVYDCFGAGHSSTSLSAAIGFAEADHLLGKQVKTVALVGDGAFTGGMIHEAMNNLKKDRQIVIILNENEMSISKNIGRFASHLAKIRTRTGYYKAKNAAGRTLKRIPLIGHLTFAAIRKVKKTIKNSLYGSNYFEDLGIYYLGPVDGHNITNLISVLGEARDYSGISLVHVKTQKGKGYPPAEENPNAFHGISPASSHRSDGPNFSTIAGTKLTELASKDEKICAITAAMCEGTGLTAFRNAHPDRYFDVGIAEEHAVTFAAALAASGFKPVFAVYSTFLQRSYDQLIHDCALQNLPITLCIDRAGLSSGDGPTHHGIFDVSMLLQLPDADITVPVTGRSLERALEEALSSEHPGQIRAIRYPNDTECSLIVSHFGLEEQSGWDCRLDPLFLDHPDAVLLTYGRIVKEAIKAQDRLLSEGIRLGIGLFEKIDAYDPVFDAVRQMKKPFIILEEGILQGGFGERVEHLYHDLDLTVMAIEQPFATAQEGQTVWDAMGLGSDAIVSRVKQLLS